MKFVDKQRNMRIHDYTTILEGFNNYFYDVFAIYRLFPPIG